MMKLLSTEQNFFAECEENYVMGAWSFTNWEPGEPNNYGSAGEDAITWFYDGFYNENGFTWNDRNSNILCPSLIEYNTKPF